jgi:hypothetical protein
MRMPALPESIRQLFDADPEAAQWLLGARSALCLALDALYGKRYMDDGYNTRQVAAHIVDKVLSNRGPELTEHDAYTERASELFDEIPVEDDDGDE